MQPTREQCAAIHRHDKNLLVVAGAGTGKTRILVERFLQLLANNPDWEVGSLVAITFTRAAAWEMRERLRTELESRAHDEGGQWARHLENMDSARIDTIHGLCADLLRANAAQAGIDPLFDVLDETEAGIMLADAVSDSLADIESPLAGLFARYDPFVIDSALKNMALVNADYPPLPSDPARLMEIWQAQWGEALLRERDNLMRSDDCDAVTQLDMPPPGDKLTDLALRYNDYLGQLEWAEDAGEILRLMTDCYTEGAVGNRGSVKAWGGKEAKKQAADTLRNLRDRMKDCLDVAGEAPGELDQASAEALILWDGLLRDVRARYQAAKRERALLDFDDLEWLAADLLNDPSVRARYRNSEFRHLLVDEFQDTNAAQWRIIQSLADLNRGGSLFLVGDPKQSIYQFRGADVSVFNRVREAMSAQSQAIELPLSTSFRAHQPLVEQFNAMFQRILTRDEGSPARDYEVVFDQPMRAFRDEAPTEAALELMLLDRGIRDESGEYVRVGRRKQNYAAEDMRRWEAAELAKRIQAMIASERRVYDKRSGKWGPIRSGDIAILFRALTNVTLYEDAFKAHDIPYLTVAGRGYFDRQEVWDMLDLLRALHNPADNLSLASALRSPMFALSDDLLFALRLTRDETGETLPLWDALQTADDSRTGIESSDLPTLWHARDTLDELRQMAGRVSISELLRRALDMTHYQAILTGLPDGDRLRGNIDKLLQLADDSGKGSLGKFAQYLGDLTAREAREGEALLEQEDAVRLMSVHASKGLEFPMVILADASWSATARNATLLVDPHFGLSCQVYDPAGSKYENGFAHRRNHDLQKRRAAAEEKRLLYVAATRAQDYLLVSGAVSLGRGDLWTARGWLGMLLETLGVDDLPRRELQIAHWAGRDLRVVMPPQPPDDRHARAPRYEGADLWQSDRNASPLMPPLLRTLPAYHAPPVHITVSQLADLGESRFANDESSRRKALSRFRGSALYDLPQPGYPLHLDNQRANPRQIGLIAHELLRQQAFSPQPPSADMIEAVAWQHGITGARAALGAISEVRRLLDIYARSDVCDWIRQAKRDNRPVHTELPFVLRRHGRVIHGAMDALLQDESGGWRVIDYKSGDPGADIAATARQFQLQMGVYAAAVQTQLNLRELPRVFVHFLRRKNAVELDRGDCQRELARLEDTLAKAVGA